MAEVGLKGDSMVQLEDRLGQLCCSSDYITSMDCSSLISPGHLRALMWAIEGSRMKRKWKKDELLRFIWPIGAEAACEAAAKAGFLPLIGELGLNLALNPKRYPGANIGNKAQLMALTCLHTNRMIARQGGGEEGSKGVEMAGATCSIVLQSYNWFSKCITMEIFSKHIPLNYEEKGVDKLMIRGL